MAQIMSRFLILPLFAFISLGVYGVATAAVIEPYPLSMVSVFKQNCAKDQTMNTYCDCVIESVQKTIPLAEFIELGNKPGAIGEDARFIKASQDCAAATVQNVSPDSAATAAPATPAPTAETVPVTQPEQTKTYDNNPLPFTPPVPANAAASQESPAVNSAPTPSRAAAPEGAAPVPVEPQTQMIPAASPESAPTLAAPAEPAAQAPDTSTPAPTFLPPSRYAPSR